MTAISPKAIGDRLAEAKGYKALRGVDAIYFYLVDRFGWTLEYARSLDRRDYWFLLAEEFATWTEDRPSTPGIDGQT